MERDQHSAPTWERKRGAHLSMAERGAIRSLRGLALSLRQIALQIECSPSTVMYELKRGTPRKTKTRGRTPKYRATLGQKTYEAHRKRPGLSKCGRFLEWLTGQDRRHKGSFDACTFTELRTEEWAMCGAAAFFLTSGFLAPRPCTFQRSGESNALRASLLPVTPFALAVYLKRGKRRKRGSGRVFGSS